MNMENSIRVAVRVRPLILNQDENVIKYIQEEGESPILMVSNNKRYVYAFDHIFSEEVHQCEVYHIMVKPLVDKMINGYNCTILAYGQTGTGKTFTMGSDSQRYHDSDAGLIPRVLDELFEASVNDSTMNISISFVEIYNEKVYDLLMPTNKVALNVKGFQVQGMTCVGVQNNEEVRHWLLVGSKGRHVRSTTLNAYSSRSHAIFTVYCERIQNGGSVVSKLHLVDLAGSESVRRTGNQGPAFQEGVTINKGLLAVGRVIIALSKKRSTMVVPYRDSILTTILHDSLNVQNYVSLLACVSPSDADVMETLATLRFAVAAKALRSTPQLEQIINKYDKNHPGVLPPSETFTFTTTVKKKRKKRELVTSTQVKNPRKDIDSPTYGDIDSMSVSTSTTIGAQHRQTRQSSFALSPLVQRCTDALQNTVIGHVNSVLKERLAFIPTPTRVTDKENSPPILLKWSTVKNKVTEIIQSELGHLTNTTVKNDSRKISPISKRQLCFDTSSPLASELADARQKSETLENKQCPDDSTTFKMPGSFGLRKMKVKDALPRPMPAPRFSINPMKSAFVGSPAFRATRRSLRLSMKFLSPKKPLINQTNVPATPVPLPRSILKENQTVNSVKSSDVSIPVPTPRQSIFRKTRQSTIDRFLEKTETEKSSVKKPKIPKKTVNTPLKKHRDNVMRILNKGTQKELQMLSTVGPKTALQILTFRTLNGPFKKLQDLQKVPTWKDKRFHKFIFANQL